MSALPKPKTRMTPAQYLAWERTQEAKHEYYDGEIVAFAGASDAHLRLVFNIAGLLYPQLLQRGCSGSVSDRRVRVGNQRAYVYPDVVVVCGDRQFAEDQKDTLLNPTLIIEVLSPSTALIDYNKKMSLYTALPSLREYLIVSQDVVNVDRLTRHTDGAWIYSSVTSIEAELVLPSIGCTLRMADVYQGVELLTPDTDAPSEDA